MNIYDISKKAGVSIATVSRVINGNDNVSSKTKAKVLAIIEECGYTPNVFARGLGTNSMQTIGILCADSSDPYLAKAIYYLEGILRQNGYDSLLCCTGYSLEAKKNCLNLLLGKRVDSIILVGSNYVEMDDSLNKYIRDAAQTVPIVIVNGALNGNNIYSTLCDDSQAIFDTVSQCFNAGIKDIIYLYNNLSYSGLKKLDGYKEAFRAHGLPLCENLIQQIVESEDTVLHVKNRLLDLVESGLKFKAVITANDTLAVGAIKYAKTVGVEIPRDLFVIGYNNSTIAQLCEPELTSIDNKLQLICNQSITFLMDVLAGKNAPQKTMFSATLVERNTTNFKKSLEETGRA